MYVRSTPIVEAYHYNIITVDIQVTPDQVFSYPPAKVWENVHPGTNVDYTWEKMTDLRTLHLQETWKLVSNTNAPK
ncbi:MAG: hypothetical protein KJO50_02170 [Bacteroidia bacterium]|nr:hypothetical protein [Bacteroidia bacterium]